jgi:hypothetical protein
MGQRFHLIIDCRQVIREGIDLALELSQDLAAALDGGAHLALGCWSLPAPDTFLC